MRGLRTKCENFLLRCHEEMPPVICLSETWLNGNYHNSELFPDGYLIFRKDRDLSLSGKERGGGVLIAVNTNQCEYFVERVPQLECHNSVWVKLSDHRGSILYISTVYIEPNSSPEVYEDFYGGCDRYAFEDGASIVIVGDFNMDVRGSNCDLLMNNPCNGLKLFINYNNLTSINNVLNKDGKTLDLVLTNYLNIEVSEALSSLSKVDLYHPPLNITFLCSKVRKKKKVFNLSETSIFKYNFTKGDFELFYRSLSEVDWSILVNITDVNKAVEKFYTIIHEILDKCFPPVQFCNSSYPPWYNKSLINKIKSKAKFREKFKKNGFPRDRLMFMQLRDEVHEENKTLYREYVKKIEDRIVGDPRSFWDFVNKKKTSATDSHLFVVDGDNVTDGKSICDAFARHFVSVYNINDTLNSSQVISDSLMNTFNDILLINEISHQDINDAIRELKPKKSLSHDGIPPYIVKGCGAIFMTPLHHLYNLSIRTSTFPNLWKLATIIPVYKKGDRKLISNYRPIALLSPFAKVFESVIYKYIWHYIMKYMSDYQHGFFPGRSVITNLSVFNEYITRQMDSGRQIDAIYLDFSKAFDTVNHELLCKKLNNYGFSDPLCAFLHSFLNDRNQFVLFNNNKSFEYVARSGVPQGSKLGPLLFIIFINDLCNNIKECKSLLYADDLKIYNVINNIEDCMLIQSTLSSLQQWCNDNFLSLNVEKCITCSYSRKKNNILFDYSIEGTILDRTDKVRDLGIIYDSKFTFNEHCVTIVNKAFRTLGFIKRNVRHFNRISTMKILYCSLVRSQVEFAPVIWNPTTAFHTNLVERVQRVFLRYVFYRQVGLPSLGVGYDNLLDLFEMECLAGRRRDAIYKNFCDLLGDRWDCSELLAEVGFRVPAFALRFGSLFYLRQCRTGIGERSPVLRMIVEYTRREADLSI